MKRAWDIVSFLAVVHLLAAVMAGAWLWRSGRLDVERLGRLRAMLSTTVAEEQAAEAEAAVAAGAAEAEAAARARRENPPLPSAAELARTATDDEQAIQAIRRLEDHAAMHEAALNLRSTALDERERALETRREAWDESIAEEFSRRVDDQFQKTVRLYEALAGKQAKRMLLELVRTGQADQAVAYLDAMSTRAASKTLREMKDDTENALATELLERIRLFGIEAEMAEAARDDDSLSSAQ